MRVWSLFVASALMACGAAQGEIVATARSPEGKFQEFRVVLDAEKAPRAVANFMGLADGSRMWVDPVTKGVRGGVGDAFYDGMSFDWHMGSLIRGGLKPVERDGMTECTGGPGYTIKSETGGSGWSEVEEGALVLVERIPTLDGALVGPNWAGWFGDVSEVDVRHGGGAELGLFLTNGVVPWTVFGQVPEEDRAGLRSLSEAVGREITEVRWELDASEMSDAERAALDAARAELPVVRGCETRPTAAGPVWKWSGNSRLWFSMTTNPAAGWHHLDIWNEGGEMTTNVPWNELGWTEGDEVVTLGGSQGFVCFNEAEYPAMTGTPFGGKWTIGVKHTGLDMQYWLDFDGGTGLWAKVEGPDVTESGTLSGVRCARETGNSIVVRFFLETSIRYYWFGVEQDAETEGRFQSVQIEVFDDEYRTDNGRCEWMEGWSEADDGEKREFPVARRMNPLWLAAPPAISPDQGRRGGGLANPWPDAAPERARRGPWRRGTFQFGK